LNHFCFLRVPGVPLRLLPASPPPLSQTGPSGNAEAPGMLFQAEFVQKLQFLNNSYKVSVRKKAVKNIEKAPEPVRILFDQLMQDLRDTGPVQTEWPHFSELSEKTCHLHKKSDRPVLVDIYCRIIS
jgi:hypothetical protein